MPERERDHIATQFITAHKESLHGHSRLTGQPAQIWLSSRLLSVIERGGNLVISGRNGEQKLTAIFPDQKYGHDVYKVRNM